MANVDHTDRRSEDRTCCNLPAKIVIDGASEAIPCIVKDLSVAGAKIEVVEAARLPDQFNLMVPAIPGADQVFRVKVQWRESNLIGGSFL